MIAASAAENKPGETYSSWLGRLSPEEQWDAYLPCGYWYDLVVASQIKRLLQREMPADLRLRFLELLNRKASGLVTMEAIAAIQPACDAAMAMIEELEPLSIADKCRVMRRIEVFDAHIALNPSILDAVKLRRGYARAAAWVGTHA
jgi:hypothetical protein